MDERHLSFDFQVFVRTTCDTYKIFVSFRKCLGTDTSWTSPLTTPELPKFCSKTAEPRYLHLAMKKDERSFSLPSICTHHMEYIKDIYIIQEAPWYWYSTTEYVDHPRTPKTLLWNRWTEIHLAMKKDEWHLNYDFQIFAPITWDIQKIFVSFRKCYGTDSSLKC